MKSSVVEGLMQSGFFLTIINIPLTLSSTAPYFYDAGGIRSVCQRSF